MITGLKLNIINAIVNTRVFQIAPDSTHFFNILMSFYDEKNAIFNQLLMKSE